MEERLQELGEWATLQDVAEVLSESPAIPIWAKGAEDAEAVAAGLHAGNVYKQEQKLKTLVAAGRIKQNPVDGTLFLCVADVLPALAGDSPVQGNSAPTAYEWMAFEDAMQKYKSIVTDDIDVPKILKRVENRLKKAAQRDNAYQKGFVKRNWFNKWYSTQLDKIEKSTL